MRSLGNQLHRNGASVNQHVVAIDIHIAVDMTHEGVSHRTLAEGSHHHVLQISSVGLAVDIGADGLLAVIIQHFVRCCHLRGEDDTVVLYECALGQGSLRE